LRYTSLVFAGSVHGTNRLSGSAAAVPIFQKRVDRIVRATLPLTGQDKLVTDGLDEQLFLQAYKRARTGSNVLRMRT